MPRNPGLVLTKALHQGLSAVVNLSRVRITEQTAHLFRGGMGRKGMRKVWTEAQEDYRRSVALRSPDARHLQRAENNIRKSFYSILFNTAAKYGNTEEKRKRRGEDRRYLNALKDYAGARLRDVGASRYPFPPTKQLYLESGDVVRGYRGNSRRPLYVPRHTAPELDFMDMIRGHTDELARQCMKYNVPPKDARNLIAKLVERLTSFLDYVYTGGRTGRPHFVRDATKELRTIVLELAALYGTRNGLRPSVTASLQGSQWSGPTLRQPGDYSHVEEAESTGAVNEAQTRGAEPDSDEEQHSISSLFTELIDRCDIGNNPERREPVKVLRSLLANRILTDRDARYLLDRLAEESRKLGAEFHDFVASSAFTLRPFSLFQVIRHEDDTLTTGTGLLCASEIPLVKEAARVDQCLFRRKELVRPDGSRGPVLYEPDMLVEVKTKTAFDLDAFATPTESKKQPDRRVIEFDLERRRMTNEEWTGVLSNTPSQYETAQLDAYETALLTEYRSIARSDPDPPSCLSKAVLVVDPSENWALVRTCLPELLFTAHSAMEKGLGRSVFHCEIRGRRLHAALVTLPSSRQSRTISPPKNAHMFDPFQFSRSRNDDRDLTLYLTVAARGSPSESAAVISGQWHGLQLVHSRSRRRNVFWIDLTGEYSDPALREQRLWLRQQTRAIRSIVRKRVSFIDLSQEFREYASGSRPLQSVIEHVKAAIGSSTSPLIVITGADVVRKTMVAGLSEFLAQLLDTSPPGSSVLWFDRPVPLAMTSERYGTRCVAPFYPDSPWARRVDQIVWNLPAPPPKYGSHAPADDDVRVIAHETRSGMQTEIATVDVLYGWGERFRSDEPPEDASREIYLRVDGISQGTIGRPSRTYSEADIDAALELVPHLTEHESVSTLTDELAVVREDVPLDTELPRGIMSRVRLTPRQSSVSRDIDGRVRRLEPLARVNHRRQYRTTRLHVQPPKWNTRPPAEGILGVIDRSMEEIAERERTALRRTLRLLKKRLSAEGSFGELVRLLELTLVIHRETEPTTGTSVLRAVSKIIESHASSRDLWRTLKHDRSQTPPVLDEVQTEYLEGLRVQHPDLFLITGNDMFLLILSALNEAGIKEQPTHLVRQLWDHVLPWQLTRLGLEPRYHSQHRTGKSVLHRLMILKTLKRRATALSAALESGMNVTETRFGQAMLTEVKERDSRQQLLWVLFQYRPGSTDMHAMLTAPSASTGLGLREDFMALPRDRPYWGETDVTRLSTAATRAKKVATLDLMIAVQRGSQGLWVLNEDRTEWLPVGRVEYYARRRENVTLVRSMTVLEDASLRPVTTEDAQSLPSDMDGLVEVAKGVIGVAFKGCESAKCSVTLDHRKKEFSLTVEPNEANTHHDRSPLGLTTESTAEILELLRRPEMDCEPVTAGGRPFVWNRFRDIHYEGDAVLLRPWVERREPFKTTGLSLPKAASDLIDAKRRSGIQLHIVHSPEVCPLRPVSLAEADLVRKPHEADVSDDLSFIEGFQGQPDPLLNESLNRHGLCWRVGLHSKHSLPSGVARLEDLQLSGAALACLLRTGALVYHDGTRWTVHEFEVPDVSSLPREFRESTHLVEAYRSIVPGALIELSMPGSSLLKREEMWTVNVNFERGWAMWSALSDLTTQYYEGRTFTVELGHGTPVDLAAQRVLSAITIHIPEKNIREFEELKERIKLGLRDAGHPDTTRRRQEVEEEGGKRLKVDVMKLTMEYTRLRDEAGALVMEGRHEEALEVMDQSIRLLEPSLDHRAARVLLVDVLISKLELLTSGKMARTPDPVLLLSISDRVKELASGVDARVLVSKSELGRRVIWVLKLRESLKKRVRSEK